MFKHIYKYMRMISEGNGATRLALIMKFSKNANHVGDYNPWD